MILISHRGNVNGSNSKLENKPSYIIDALNSGFNVEVDVWYENGWWLGHDKPQYKMLKNWYEKSISYNRLWIHCKNLEALSKLAEFDVIHGVSVPHYFWHENDKFTLTSYGFIWTYPRSPLTKASICVMPELCAWTNKELKKCYGICSDRISEYKTLL